MKALLYPQLSALLNAKTVTQIRCKSNTMKRKQCIIFLKSATALVLRQKIRDASSDIALTLVQREEN